MAGGQVVSSEALGGDHEEMLTGMKRSSVLTAALVAMVLRASRGVPSLSVTGEVNLICLAVPFVKLA